MTEHTPARLHHLALGARDVAALASFYREVFALREIARHDGPDGQLRSIWLELGGAILMIEKTLAAPRCVEGTGSGVFLIAFSVRPNERATLERALEARGHAIESRTPFTSYTRDPEGNRVGISHFPEPSPDSCPR